ncbi:MAG: hypothetical protein CPSOU_0307 [uncultured Paraburkholderia sp.]|nr:MAG: hypothetical protein CPSOU_0307 [uncultured Paraburkholderia sp.]
MMLRRLLAARGFAAPTGARWWARGSARCIEGRPESSHTHGSPIAADVASCTSRQSQVGRPVRRAASRRIGQIEPLWAESGKVGSAAAPGGAGEALVGQTSSGVRLSDSSSAFCAARSCAAAFSAAASAAFSAASSYTAGLHVRLHLLATSCPFPTFLDSSPDLFLLHS